MSKLVGNVNDSNFKSDVLDAQRPVLVDFWAEWCAPCRMLTPVIEELSQVYRDSIQVVKLNVDENPEVASNYRIKGIPTLILFKDGSEQERIVGAATKQAIAKTIERHVEAAK